MNSETQQIIDFIIKEGEGLYSNISKEVLEEIINKHIKYGTFLIVRDMEGIAAIARWNWINDITVILLDVVIKKEYRSPHFTRELIALGVSRNKQCKFIGFKRGKKYPQRELRFYSVDEWLKRKVK